MENSQLKREVRCRDQWFKSRVVSVGIGEIYHSAHWLTSAQYWHHDPKAITTSRGHEGCCDPYGGLRGGAEGVRTPHGGLHRSTKGVTTLAATSTRVWRGCNPGNSLRWDVQGATTHHDLRKVAALAIVATISSLIHYFFLHQNKQREKKYLLL